MLGSRWLENYLYAFAGSSWAIAALAAVAAYFGGHADLYFIALITLVFRGIVLPYLIWRIIRTLEVDREIHEIIQPSSGLVIGALLVMFAFAVSVRLADRLGLEHSAVLALTVMLSMTLIGFLMLAVRREALSQILGLLVVESGIRLGAQILVPGMPLLLEL